MALLINHWGVSSMPVEISSESIELQYGASIQFFNEFYLGLSSLGSPCFYQIMTCLTVVFALLMGFGFLVRASVVFVLFYLVYMPMEVLWPSGATTQLPFLMAYGIERFGDYSDAKRLMVSGAAAFGGMLAALFGCPSVLRSNFYNKEPVVTNKDFGEQDELLENQIKNRSDDFKLFSTVKEGL